MLKKAHVLLEMKYQELELAYEAIGANGHEDDREVTKTNVSTSCDDLVEEPKVLLNDENIASSSKNNHARVKSLEEKVRSLRSCVKTLAKGVTQGDPLLQCKSLWDKGTWFFPKSFHGNS
jgi:hypothetical protein